MDLLPSYSLDTAACQLGISKDFLMQLIKDGGVSVAVSVYDLSFGYIHLETRKRTYPDDVLFDFGRLLGEDSVAYAYLALSSPFCSGLNHRLNLDNHIHLRNFDVFSKHPIGHEESLKYENLFQRVYPTQKEILEQMREDAYTIPLYVTRNALLSSPVTRQMLENPIRKTNLGNQQVQALKIIEEFRDVQQIAAAAKAIKAIEEVLLGREYTQPQTGLYAETFRRVLVEKFGDKIPKEPTLNKHIEMERARRGLRGVSLPRDSLRNMLAHIEEKTN